MTPTRAASSTRRARDIPTRESRDRVGGYQNVDREWGKEGEPSLLRHSISVFVLTFLEGGNIFKEISDTT